MKRPVASILVPLIAVALALHGPTRAQAPAPAPAAAPAGGAAAAPKLSQDQLDSLVAPIALYPDQLLVQTLMASTYPLDVVEAARFVKANRDKLKGDAMVKAAEDKNWDPSVQSLTAFPQVLEMMNEKLEWTQQLGDAVLADEKAVMLTAQRLRTKASEAGNLKSNEQQKVVVQQDKTIVIEPAQSTTVYVPTYNPAVVYGTWWAPGYPPYYYPPAPYYYPGYVAGAALVGFGVGLAVGAAWGWAGANWGGNNINVNVNNNFVRNNNNANFKNNVNNGNWNHNAAQRKGVAYRDQGTRDKYGASDRGGAAGRSDYRGHEGAGAGNRANQGGIDRGSGPSAETMDRGGGGASAANRSGAGGSQNFGGGSQGISASSPANRSGGGNYGGAGGGNYGGAGGGNYGGAGSFNSGQNRAQTTSASNRGASSRSSMSGGGGGARPSGGGGGGRGGGGGGRGGGGRR
jgi:hypothetical protein